MHIRSEISDWQFIWCISEWPDPYTCYKMISNHRDYISFQRRQKSNKNPEKHHKNIHNTTTSHPTPSLFERNILSIYANIYDRIHDLRNRPQAPDIETAHMHHQETHFSYNSFSHYSFVIIANNDIEHYYSYTCMTSWTPHTPIPCSMMKLWHHPSCIHLSYDYFPLTPSQTFPLASNV